MFQNWANSFVDSWTLIIEKIINFIPNILGAAIILAVGWFVAILLEQIVDKIIRVVGLESLFEKIKLEDSIQKMGIKKDMAALTGALFKWVIYLVAFIGAADTLNLTQVTDFLNRILGYLPNVVAGAGIMLIGIVLANFIGNAVQAVVKGAEFGYPELVGSIARYAILVFAFLATLAELRVAPNLIQILFTGFVAMLAIAGGLAFGLGGKDVANDLLGKIKRDVSERR